MSTTQYVFGGSSRQLGRFGFVETGQILELTPGEVATIQGNANFAPVPTPSPQDVVLTTGTALTAAVAGKLIRSQHSAAVEYDLPETPALGEKYEIEDDSEAGAATNNITIDPGEAEIEGVEGSAVIDTDGGRYGVFWTGAVWKPF